MHRIFNRFSDKFFLSCLYRNEFSSNLFQAKRAIDIYSTIHGAINYSSSHSHLYDRILRTV